MNDIPKPVLPATIHCSTCQAACCRMQVMIIDDTGMPERFIETDGSGVQSMRRLDDGWCEALNRNTFLCDQYLVRPAICRQFEMGGADCQSTRIDVTAPWIGDEPAG